MKIQKASLITLAILSTISAQASNFVVFMGHSGIGGKFSADYITSNNSGNNGSGEGEDGNSEDDQIQNPTFDQKQCQTIQNHFNNNASYIIQSSTQNINGCDLADELYFLSPFWQENTDKLKDIRYPLKTMKLLSTESVYNNEEGVMPENSGWNSNLKFFFNHVNRIDNLEVNNTETYKFSKLTNSNVFVKAMPDVLVNFSSFDNLKKGSFKLSGPSKFDTDVSAKDYIFKAPSKNSNLCKAYKNKDIKITFEYSDITQEYKDKVINTFNNACI